MLTSATAGTCFGRASNRSRDRLLRLIAGNLEEVGRSLQFDQDGKYTQVTAVKIDISKRLQLIVVSGALGERPEGFESPTF